MCRAPLPHSLILDKAEYTWYEHPLSLYRGISNEEKNIYNVGTWTTIRRKPPSGSSPTGWERPSETSPSRRRRRRRSRRRCQVPENCFKKLISMFLIFLTFSSINGSTLSPISTLHSSFKWRFETFSLHYGAICSRGLMLHEWEGIKQV